MGAGGATSAHTKPYEFPVITIFYTHNTIRHASSGELQPSAHHLPPDKAYHIHHLGSPRDFSASPSLCSCPSTPQAPARSDLTPLNPISKVPSPSSEPS